jgi:phage terminase large subunit
LNAVSSTLSIDTAAVFVPLLQPAPYKGAHGGRGSGKSHFFAELMVEESIANPGLRSVCIREVQKDLKDSAKLLIEDKIQRLGVGHLFEVQREMIATPGGGQIIFRGMQDYNSESIKSLEGFHRAWIEEAHTLSARSLTLLRPTIREEGSEIWASWNPRRKTDPVDEFLRKLKPDSAIVVEANWRDNPFFPKKLNDDRLLDLERYPDQYAHVWDGDYVSIYSGGYFAKQLAAAKAKRQIASIAADELMTYRAIWDIGGTGARADAVAIWIAQFIGPQIRVLDYYEAVGQPLAAHVNWLRDNGYGKALCILPHDGATHDKVFDVTYESELKRAGFEVKVIPNQGRGAAMKRVEAARRLFPNIWFNEATTEAGLEALGAYHERKDEVRGIGLGPEHDWSSHGADAFGLMCIAHEEPTEQGWGALPKQRTRVV